MAGHDSTCFSKSNTAVMNYNSAYGQQHMETEIGKLDIQGDKVSNIKKNKVVMNE
jgi:hypothetical protein